MYTVLVRYNEFQEPGHAMLDGEWVKQSKIVDIKDLKEINTTFTNVVTIKVIERDLSGQKQRIIDLEGAIESTIAGLEWMMSDEEGKSKLDKSDYEHYDMLRKLMGIEVGE